MNLPQVIVLFAVEKFSNQSKVILLFVEHVVLIVAVSYKSILSTVESVILIDELSLIVIQWSIWLPLSSVNLSTVELAIFKVALSYVLIS